MKKKQFTLVGLIILFIACSRDNDGASNQDIVKDKMWKAFDYKRNGTVDATVISQQPTFNFRSDSKVYFSQINPVFRDTFNYQFIDDNNIRLNKTQASTSYYLNFKIDRLTENDFDFTATDNQTTVVHNYKTTKQ